MKIRLISILFMLISIIIYASCRDDSYYDKGIIKKFSKQGYEYPTSSAGTILFILVENNKIGKVTFSRLQMMYSLDYSKKYKSFFRFLEDVLNQKISFKEEYVIKRKGIVFRLNENVRKTYRMAGIDVIIRTHCEKSGERYEIKDDTLNDEEIFSIMYFLSINNYIITHDDVLGTIFAKLY